MAKHTVLFGAVAYTDSDGNEAWARTGDEVEFNAADTKRLLAMGAIAGGGKDDEEKVAAAKADAQRLAAQPSAEPPK
jgi:hypothetical protein